MISINEPLVVNNEALATSTLAELIDLMIEYEDRVPRKLIDACANRGEQMLDVLASLARPSHDQESVDSGHWWLRLHAVMILGLISGERAGQVLIEFIYGMSSEGDHDLQDWLAGYWPALFSNKPQSVVAPLRNICMNKEIDWYMRTNMVEATLSQAQQQGSAALEQALDWAAQIAADENDDWEYRLMVANGLLDFPRDRHRDLLTGLATRQQYIGRHFDISNIDKAYARGTDMPGWVRFDNPWRFYEPREIEKRQHRWQKEDQQQQEWDTGHDDLSGSIPDCYHQQTYQRDTPKIGRNEPCPCGSGKKYKKCCLGKQ